MLYSDASHTLRSKSDKEEKSMEFPFKEAKRIDKPWGEEIWISDGVRMPYALKRIIFKANNRSSLQVHEFKNETNFVLEGTGKFQISNVHFDCKAFLQSDNPEELVRQALTNIIEVDIKAGDVIDVKAGQIHRVIAITDLVFIEASTPELDDVIRLADDANRSHGKSESEHSC